jgi:methyl-accepting chemotaxis protein
VKIRTLKGFLHRVNVLLDQASRGDLEHRLVKEREGGELGQMVLHLNYFLDVVEAFLREIITPLKYAGERKYWRKKGINNITERLSRIRDESQKTVGVAKEGREGAEKIVFELNGPIKTVESYAHVVEELAQKAGSVTSY